MEISKNQIRVNDDVVLTHGKSEAKGPVTRVQKSDTGAVLAVWLPGWEKSFWLSPEAVNAEEWGRPVWEVENADRPDVRRGTVMTAETDGGQRRLIFRTSGVHLGSGEFPWVDEHGNLLKHDELRNIEPEPDWKAAVDAYARGFQRVRVAVDQLEMPAAARQGLHHVLDQVYDERARFVPEAAS